MAHNRFRFQRHGAKFQFRENRKKKCPRAKPLHITWIPPSRRSATLIGLRRCLPYESPCIAPKVPIRFDPPRQPFGKEKKRNARFKKPTAAHIHNVALEIMGFSWRGKGSKAPGVLADAEATGAELSPDMSEPVTQERNFSRFKSQHRWDPFLDIEKIDAVDEIVASGDPEKRHTIEDSLIIENSPYPEVRSAVCFPLLCLVITFPSSCFFGEGRL